MWLLSIGISLLAFQAVSVAAVKKKIPTSYPWDPHTTNPNCCGPPPPMPTPNYPPADTSCTKASQDPSLFWEVSNFTFDTWTRDTYGVGTAGFVTLTIKNRANGYSFSWSDGSQAPLFATDWGNYRTENHYLEDGLVWYSSNGWCNASWSPSTNYIPSPGMSINGQAYYYPALTKDGPPLVTSFHFNVNTKELRLRQSWVCNDTNTGQ
jgi:hypothetical protein